MYMIQISKVSFSNEPGTKHLLLGASIIPCRHLAPELPGDRCSLPGDMKGVQVGYQYVIRECLNQVASALRSKVNVQT